MFTNLLKLFVVDHDVTFVVGVSVSNVVRIPSASHKQLVVCCGSLLESLPSIPSRRSLLFSCWCTLKQKTQTFSGCSVTLSNIVTGSIIVTYDRWMQLRYEKQQKNRSPNCIYMELYSSNRTIFIRKLHICADSTHFGTFDYIHHNSMI